MESYTEKLSELFRVVGRGWSGLEDGTIHITRVIYIYIKITTSQELCNIFKCMCDRQYRGSAGRPHVLAHIVLANIVVFQNSSQ